MRRDELNLPEPPPYDRPGDRWMCGTRHDTCPNGPTRAGKCPLADACRPKRTWRGHRRKMVMIALACVVAIMTYASRPGVAPKVFKPGGLSKPHAQILSSTITSSRCASCHESASTNPQDWFLSAGDGHADVSQTDRCLECHHKTIDPKRAKLAHNLPGSLRSQIRNRIRLTSAKSGDSWHDALPGPAVDQEDVDCAACHREHGGVSADLLAVSDAQCQTCHDNRFGSFATSHPQWEQWPYGRGGEIAFDHQTHMTKHFPGSKIGGAAATFACESCHTVNENNELTRSVSYENGCQSCHDEALKLESAKGFDLVALPTVTDAAADLAGEWPVAARGFMEGKITPLSDLLMRVDPAVASAIRQIPDRDLVRLDPDGPTTDTTASAVATAHRVLLLELANEGHPALIARGTQAGISPRAMATLIRTLPPQLLIQAYEKWFPETAETGLEVSRRTPPAPVVQVDFTRAFEEPPRDEPSLLLPIVPEEDYLFGVPHIAQRLRGQASSRGKSIVDSADDGTLLGGSPPQKTQANKTKPSAEPLVSDDVLLGKAGDDSDHLNDEMSQETGVNEFRLTDQTNDSSSPGDNDLLLAPSDDAGDALLADDSSATGDALLGDDALLADDSVLADDALLADDPLSADPLMGDPLAEAPAASSKGKPKRFSPEKMMPSGGWYRDDIRLAIGYRGSGHADPVLQAAVELVHQLPPTDLVRLRLLANRSVAACVECHKGSTNITPDWHGHDLVGRKNSFTKFAHSSHLNVAALADCKHCHVVNLNENGNQSGVTLASFSERLSADTNASAEFMPINRQACATCHTPKAAGDSCVTCHRYHIHP